MRSFNAALLLLGSIVPSVFADVQFTVPAAGLTYPGGTSITVSWTESQTAPLLTALDTYTLFLCTGSNTAPTQLMDFGGVGTFTAGSSTAVTIPTTAGGTTKNA
jgi:hypothetical protein